MNIDDACVGAVRWFVALPPSAQRGSRTRIPLRMAVAIALSLLFLSHIVAWAVSASTFPGSTNYSQQQIANMFAQSSNPILAANASSFAAMSHNVEDPNGGTGTYNGSCCTGVMQLNGGNLANQSICGCTPAQFGAMSGQQQIDVYTKYFNTVQNSSGMKQLEAMEAAGQSLGGVPVNGAMLAACAQLGTGNCAAAIKNGCSSLANGSGGDGHVNICTMAAKASAGPQVSANGQVTPGTPSTATTPPSTASSGTQPSSQTVNSPGGSQSLSANSNSSGRTPESPGASGSLMNIGDPTICWVCNAALYSIGAIEAVNTNASTQFVGFLWPLLVTFAAIGFVVKIGSAIVVGANPWSVALKFMLRMSVVLALFSGGAMQPFGSNGSSAPSDPGISVSLTDIGRATPSSGATVVTDTGSLLFDYIISPPLQAGSAIAADLISKANTAMNVTLPTANCQHDTAQAANIVQLLATADAIMAFSCELHLSVMTAIQIGGVVATHPADDTGIGDQAFAVVFFAVGAILMVTSCMTLISFGSALVEAILKIGIVGVFLPVFAFAWLFDSTRGMVGALMRMMLFSFFYVLFSGIAAIVMVFVLLTSFQFGLGQTTQTSGAPTPVTLSLSSVVSSFDSTFSTTAMTQPGGAGQLLMFCFFVIAGSLVSNELLKGAQGLAVEVSSAEMFRRGRMANVGPRVVSQAAEIAVGGVGLATGVGGRIASGIVGRAVGTFGRRGIPGRPSLGGGLPGSVSAARAKPAPSASPRDPLRR